MILRVHTGDANLTRQVFGVSRASLYRWRSRWNPGDPSSLEDRCTRPQRLRAPTWSRELVATPVQLRQIDALDVQILPAQYDPDLANTMLDELGLTERNSAGTRLMSNGEPLEVLIYVDGNRGINPATGGSLELIIEDWADVGVKLIKQEIDAGMNWAGFESDVQTADLSFGLAWAAGELGATIADVHHCSRQSDLPWATGWRLWYFEEIGRTIGDGGFDHKDPRRAEFVKEPPEHWKEWCHTWLQARNMIIGSPEYLEAVTKLYDYHADPVNIIGVVGSAPHQPDRARLERAWSLAGQTRAAQRLREKTPPPTAASW